MRYETDRCRDFVAHAPPGARALGALRIEAISKPTKTNHVEIDCIEPRPTLICMCINMLSDRCLDLCCDNRSSIVLLHLMYFGALRIKVVLVWSTKPCRYRKNRTETCPADPGSLTARVLQSGCLGAPIYGPPHYELICPYLTLCSNMQMNKAK